MQSDIDRRSWAWVSLRNPILPAVTSSIVAYGGRMVMLDPGQSLQALNTTFFVGLTASVLSILAIRSVSKYPGTEAVSSILSMVSLMYGVIATLLLVGRIDYVSSALIGNYSLCLLFLFIQQSPWSERRKLRIGVIEGGDARAFSTETIEWVVLDDPDMPMFDIDAVTTDLRADLDDKWERRLTELALEGTPVYHIKHLRESLTGQVQLEHLAETSFGTLSPPEFYIAVKRIVDTLISALCLVILAPVLVIVALVIRLDSSGPAIFRQARIGFRGHSFTVYKFRTMRTDRQADDNRAAAMTRKDDDRITRLGKFLRKSRVDELPQLINVLRGEMSLIGPRPEAAILSSWYENEIPFYRYRHIVLPGVTGWAQVNQGHVTDVQDVKSKLHYDFYYIKHLSPWIDFLIALRTISVMFFGQGAK